MSHDKIKAAARKRMAETGEPYATARREVIKNYQEAGTGAASSPNARWFAISYGDMDRVSLWMDTRLGGGPGRGGVEVDSTVLRVRMADFHLDIPRGSVRSAARSEHQTRGTIGVHGRRGRWLVNGSHDGLVELVIQPPCYLPRQLSTIFRRMEVSSLIISLVDADGFIAAVEGDGPHRDHGLFQDPSPPVKPGGAGETRTRDPCLQSGLICSLAGYSGPLKYQRWPSGSSTV
jgi:hypothetical protein